MDEELLFLIAELIDQSCYHEDDNTVNSGFISTYAEAIEVLVEHGYMDYVGEPRGRYVQARFTKKYTGNMDS